MINPTTGNILRSLRERKNLLLREVAASILIDPTILSNIETDERLPTSEQVKALTAYYKEEENNIVIAYLSDKLVYELLDEG